ncbi:MAG: amidohydrolase family protein [Candidatus Omnitrophica bacterium]|jgi:predicted TIM-barrel fold metal-dependent hydrolase|nr:amidohydrolase family protein [Candidatus Omnitrophota bacterium]MDD3987354.1 amidohydrolase family protein [Candidatus Omnitrophota bacterium]MDD4981601.1 amidohydrolase family protein [Candidatus Omnitrophota bacterium]MDD5664987.1 amidohydrolase family protein [Candidatus Omnitrophota bacterium]
MVIDAHSHWLPEGIINNAHFYHKGWGEIESQLRVMDGAGINKAVLSYPTSDAHLKLGSISEVVRIFNDHVSRIIRKYPDRFIGAAILPIDHEPDMIKELKRSTEELGFKAISLATSYNGIYLDDARFLQVYKIAQDKNIPVFVHSQIVNPIGFERVKDPLLTPVIEYIFDTTICIGKLLMSDILRDYGVKFIFGYFGGVTPHLTGRFDSTYQMLRSVEFVKDLKGNPTDYLKNIYVDTSGDKTEANFSAALELLGPRHILWGSDYPAKKDPAVSMQAIRDLKISQEDKENILGINLSRLLS